jgi:hypothetical protein
MTQDELAAVTVTVMLLACGEPDAQRAGTVSVWKKTARAQSVLLDSSGSFDTSP